MLLYWPIIFSFHSQISVNQERQSDKKGSKRAREVGWDEEVQKLPFLRMMLEIS